MKKFFKKFFLSLRREKIASAVFLILSLFFFFSLLFHFNLIVGIFPSWIIELLSGVFFVFSMCLWGSNNIPWQAIGSIATTFAMFFVGWQSWIANKRFELEKRPYFYVSVEPYLHLQGKKENKQSFDVGVDRVYGNRGTYSATEIEVNYCLYVNELEKCDNELDQWRIGEHRAETQVSSLPPEGKFPMEIHTMAMDFKDESKNCIQYSVRAKYKGLDKRIYAYSLDYIYMVDLKNKYTPIKLFDEKDGEMRGEKSPVENRCKNWWLEQKQ